MTLSKLEKGRRAGCWTRSVAGNAKPPAAGKATLAGVCLTVLLAGCQMKDPEKCQQALDTARKAADTQDQALVAQWREYAYKHCSEPVDLQRLDQDLVAKQAEQRKQKLEKERKQKAQEQLVGLFQQWVATNRTTPDRAGATVKCEGEDDDALKKSKERFCTRERAMVGRTDKFIVRYWEKEPQLARFEFASPEPLTCDNLGPSQVVKQLAIPAIGGKVATRTHCQINGGVLAGMQALATQANNAPQYVFSAEYLGKDPAFAQRLK